MATFKQNNIQFTAYQVNYGKDGTFGHSNNGDFSMVETFGVTPFINAVELDWNAAQLGDKTINTSGEYRCSSLVQSLAM